MTTKNANHRLRAEPVLAAGRVKMSLAVGVTLAGFPLRQLLSLRRGLRLKVSLETAFWLQAAPTAFRLSFHPPGGEWPGSPPQQVEPLKSGGGQNTTKLVSNEKPDELVVFFRCVC